MDQEVAKTLGELELKLQQLEHELTSIGHQDTPGTPGDPSYTPGDPSYEPAEGSPSPSQSPSGPSPAASGLPSAWPTPTEPHTVPVMPAHAPTGPSQPSGRLVDEAVEPSASEETLADGDGFGGPALFGGEEVPSQPGATIERDWTVEARETAYGEIPTPPAAATMPPSGGMPGPPIPPPAPMPQPPPSNPPGPPPPATPPTPTPQPGPTSPQPGPTSPQPGPAPQPIDVAELVRFKEKMRRTLEELVDEYSKLIQVDRSAGPHA